MALVAFPNIQRKPHSFATFSTGTRNSQGLDIDSFLKSQPPHGTVKSGGFGAFTAHKILVSKVSTFTSLLPTTPPKQNGLGTKSTTSQQG